MEIIYVLAFIGGILSNIVDQINDSGILIKYKPFTEFLFISIVLYALFYKNYMSFFVSALFVVGGIAGFLLAPHTIDSLVWKISIYISLPFLLYHLFNYKNLLASLSSTDIHSFFYTVVPSIAFLLLMALLEDYLVPEEYGMKKLIDKIIQMAIMCTLIYITNYTSFINLKESSPALIIFNSFLLGWLGNVVPGIFFYSYFSYLFDGKEMVTKM